MEQEVKINKIADHRRGDTWDGMVILIEEETINGLNPKDITGYKVLSRFKTTPDTLFSFEFKTEDQTITIPIGIDGKLYFKERIMNVKPNNYIFDIQLTSPDGRVETIPNGEWRILQDIS